MFLKSAVFILGIASIGVMLLELRHQRVSMMHDMAVMHRQIDQMRHSMWQSQSHISEHLQPGRLEDTLAQMRLALEPIGRDPVETVGETNDSAFAGRRSGAIERPGDSRR